MAKRITKPTAAVFRGVKYRILWRNPVGFPVKTAGGACESPLKKNCAIEISPTLKGRNKLRVLLDESTHACLWDLDNESVAECSTSQAEWLWNCGLRFIAEDTSDE